MISIILAIEVAVLGILCGIFCYISLRQEKEINSLKEEIDKKQEEYRALETSYNILDRKYDELEDKYNELAESHSSSEYSNQLDQLVELQHKTNKA